MHVNFRPTNVYSKGAQGDRTSTSGVLLRVKIKRRGNEVKTEDVKVVGITDTSYKFESMCDYEMTPLMKRTPEATHAEVIYKDIMPTIDMTSEEWLQNPTPLPYFLPPQNFTRFDSINDRKLFKTDDKYLRVKRYLREAVRIEFDLSEPVPTGPTRELCRKQVTPEDIETVRARFRERPIWSTSALRADLLVMGAIKLKFILPYVAYFYTAGPWRNLWVLYGYDPRKEFESRKYQVMDLRLNKKAVFNIKTRLEKKREEAAPTNVKNNVVSQLVFDENAEKEEKEIYSPVFTPGKFHHLTWSNLFQYCDVEVPKIQEMLDKVPSPLHGGKCSERTGWLPAGFDEECKDILMDILREYFQMEMMSKNEMDDTTMVNQTGVDEEEESQSEDEEDLEQE